MKTIKLTSLKFIVAILAVCTVQTSCKKGLLDQKSTVELPASLYFQNEADALSAIMGVYSATRPCFDRDYYFDGQGEYFRTRNGNASTTAGSFRLGDAYRAAYNPSGYGNSFGKMYMYLFGVVNRANYVIGNIERMKTSGVKADPKELERIIGEALFLRSLAYFRLISMWGDVPLIDKEVFSNAEVANIERTPIGEIKDKIVADLTLAAAVLPPVVPLSSLGRASKPAAIALRGKINLYWGSWKKYGWPELKGFQQNSAEATAAFTAAAADFKTVIDDFGLKLYMNGDPGQISPLGKADLLPNYYYLFTSKANGNSEVLFSFNHGGVNSAQGEEILRDFGTRSTGNGQNWVSPRYELADRYQLTTTGDFAPPLVPSANATLLNSATNPQSYANRDYRMKSTIVWNYEVVMTLAGLTDIKEDVFKPFVYGTPNGYVNIGGVSTNTITYEGINSGYLFRKFVRNYGGASRSEGDLSWPVIRLADVYLMYAEADNEVSAVPQQKAIDLVNAVRRRGNLPPLAGTKTNNRANFFDAIEQERIVELVGEGQRSFDLRRWRAIERVWGGPGSPGKFRIDTRGATNTTRYYQNQPDRTYEQAYIFAIPQGERDRNPLLTQNTPWE